MKKIIPYLLVFLCVAFLSSCAYEAPVTDTSKIQGKIAYLSTSSKPADLDDFEAHAANEITTLTSLSSVNDLSGFDILIVDEGLVCDDTTTDDNAIIEFYKNGGTVIVDLNDSSKLISQETLLKNLSIVVPQEDSVTDTNEQNCIEQDNIAFYAFKGTDTFAMYDPQINTKYVYNDNETTNTNAYQVKCSNVEDVNDNYAEFYKNLNEELNTKTSNVELKDYHWDNFVSWTEKSSSLESSTTNNTSTYSVSDKLASYTFTAQNTFKSSFCYYSVHGADWEYKEAVLPMAVEYTYTPVYDGNSGTETYTVEAIYKVDPQSSYEDNGKSPNHSFYPAHYRGPMLVQTKYTSEIIDNTNSDKKFSSKGQVLPTSYNGSTTYTDTSSFNIGVSVSGGATGIKSPSEGGQALIGINAGWSWSHTVQYSLPDLVVSYNNNDSTNFGRSFTHTFDYNNLPVSEFTDFSKDTPIVARTSGQYPASWVWQGSIPCDSKDEIKIKTTMQATTRLLRYYAASGGHKDMDITTPEYSVTSTLINPVRIKTGALVLKNIDPNAIIKNIKICDSSNNVVINKGQSEYSYNDSLTVALPTDGSYTIKLDMVDLSSNGKTTTKTRSNVTLTSGGTTSITFHRNDTNDWK